MRACEDDADNRDDNPDLVKKITSRGRMEYQPTKMARRKIGSRTAAAAAACLLILFIHSVYGDNRWSPVGVGAGDADTLDLRRSRSPSPSSDSRWLARSLTEEEEEPLDSFYDASQWWARQDRSTGGEYSRAFDVDGDGNVDLYDRSRIDHHVYDYIDDDDGDGDESVEGISPPVEGARRLDTFGDDILVYEDIYPKRVPSPIQRERRKHARELELFLRERYGQQRRRSQYRRNLINVNNWRETHLAGNSNPPRPHHTMATSASNSPAYSRWRPQTDTRQHRRQQRRRQRKLREQRARSYLDNTIETDVIESGGGGAVGGGGGGNSLVRSLLGVPSHCVSEEHGLQFPCSFTPSCWISGGVPQTGCDSLIYACCVSPAAAAAISRKDTDVSTGRGGFLYSSPRKRRRRRKEILRQEAECGIRPSVDNNNFSKRIIGGNRAKFAELPWQVHIRISSYQCGGVLLNHLYVATAAHCVHQAKLTQITVHLGEYDTKDTEEVKEPLESESFKVDKIILHPNFRYMLTQPDRYDIALLKLDHPVYYRDNIIPICLPSMDYPLEGKIGVVAGWGKTDNSFGKTGTNLLNKVLVPIIGNHKCRLWHKEKAIAVQLHDEMFCAGHKSGKRDACLGDSGGPLVINFDGRWTLIGITSAGFGCAVEKQPGIYHKVSKTARWIAHMIRKP